MTKPQKRKGRRPRGPSKRGGLLAGLLAFALLTLGLLFAGSASAHSRSHDQGGHSSGEHHDHGSWQQPGKGYHNPPPSHGGQTKTVSWVMVDASGSATHVTYPQDELSPKPNPAAPTCGHTIQTDVYKYDSSQDKQTVDGLVRSGVLNAGGDSSVVVSWSFAMQPACKTVPPTSPPPSHSKTPCPPKHTHTPKPTPSKTHTPSPTQSTTPPPPPTTSTTPVTPPSVSTTVVPPPVTTTVVPPHRTTTPTSTAIVPPATFTPPPGNTGDSAPSSPLGKIVLIVLAGFLLAVLASGGVAYKMFRRGRHT